MDFRKYLNASEFTGARLGAAILFLILFMCVDYVSVPLKAKLQVYYSHYVGFSWLKSHEIFSPEYLTTDKIVVLGPSYTVAWFCDSRYVRDPLDRCSIAARMNAVLTESEKNHQRVFNLGIDGSHFATLMWEALEISSVKPKVLVIAMSYYPFLADGGLNDKVELTQALIEQSPQYLAEFPQYDGWMSYLKNSVFTKTNMKGSSFVAPWLKRSLEFPALLHERLVDTAGKIYAVDDVFSFQEKAYTNEGTNIDFSYLPRDFSNLELMIRFAEKQKIKLFFYHTPLVWARGDREFDKKFRAPLRDFFARFPEVVYRDWAEYPLALGSEAMHGNHNTVKGTSVVANLIVNTLREKGWMKSL